MQLPSKTIYRLIGALSLALDEIHNPGAARASNVDIVRLCDSVLKEATKDADFDVRALIRDEMKKVSA